MATMRNFEIVPENVQVLEIIRLR